MDIAIDTLFRTFPSRYVVCKASTVSYLIQVLQQRSISILAMSHQVTRLQLSEAIHTHNDDTSERLGRCPYNPSIKYHA